MNSKVKNSIFWVVLACISVLLWQVVRSSKIRSNKEVTFTEFVTDIKAGKVKKVSISDGAEVNGTYKDSVSGLHTLIPDRYPEIYTILQDHGVEIEIQEKNTSWVAILFNAAPFILLIGFWIFMMREMRSRKNKEGTCWACGRSGPPSAA